MRVVRAAEASLARQKHVSILDVLCGMRLLEEAHLQGWKRGSVLVLEEHIQGSPAKIESTIAIFHRWANAKGLRPSDLQYTRQGRSGEIPLQVSRSGDPSVEKSFRAHYVSPDLSERRQEQLQERLDKAELPVAFLAQREEACSECGSAIERDDFFYKEAGLILCLSCAGFRDLEFLPSGNVALTRRSTKFSSRTVVLVCFNRRRKRYEREGILVEVAALEKAEKECLKDADQRAIARSRAAEKRLLVDQELVVRMAEKIAKLFPRCPVEETDKIARHTAVRGSGRVGRSEAGRALEENALTAAVIASIRHLHTDYDELLERGVPRQEARQRIAAKIDSVLARWRR